MLVLAPELYLPLRRLGAQFHASADGLAVAERMFALLDAPRRRAAGQRGSPPSPRTRPSGSRRSPSPIPRGPALVLDGFDLELAPGRDRRARRAERRRQEHGRRASCSASPSRPRARHRRRRRPRRAATDAWRRADRLGAAAPDALARHRRGQHPPRRRRPPTTRRCADAAVLAGADRVHPAAAATATRRWSATAGARCRPVSAGGSRWRARSCVTPRSSSSTSRLPTSIRRAPRSSPTPSSGCAPGEPCC